jgi:hypothetical protein
MHVFSPVTSLKFNHKGLILSQDKLAHKSPHVMGLLPNCQILFLYGKLYFQQSGVRLRKKRKRWYKSNQSIGM